ncbi:MAG: hypothetical protein JWP26_4014 [Devosia sp.]|uniref:hypothetical protein n=1 Tax=Devosia sp. TaxID=1871048 RepID=UPI002606C3CC|nr:hypothetical protein [Devosia sp.]MDB5589044.1 hypothetical protein [Devosia sp.]
MTLLSTLRAATLGLMLVAGLGQAAIAQDTVVEALGVPGPIDFLGDSYALSWTSHPTPDYFKQEYLPQGQQSDSYTAMFMVDASTSQATPQGAANTQIAGLEGRKPTDPMVNYNQISNPNTGEVILDFLLSDDSGPKPILEWNAYRYTKLGDGIALFAISRRAYGDDVEAFLGQLSQMRQDNISALAELDLPPVTPAE